MKLEHCSREALIDIVESLTKSLNAALDENQRLRDKPWIGLTDEEKTAIYEEDYNFGYELIEKAEAKLKEKNT